jgi:hypothetical protein
MCAHYGIPYCLHFIKTLFVEHNIGTFRYFEFQVLAIVDNFCLTSTDIYNSNHMMAIIKIHANEVKNHKLFIKRT